MAAPFDLLRLLDALTPAVRNSFLRAISDIKSEAQMTLAIDAIKRGDFARLVIALNIDEAFFAPLDQALRSAYLRGGEDLLKALPQLFRPDGAKIAARFNGRNERAETYLANRSSALIVEIMDDQREVIRTILTEGMEAGRGPRDVALDLVGKINQTTGRREGGVIGLTQRQTGYVINMRRELNDPATMTNYFSRKRRDKRFDAAVRRAIREGKPIPKAMADKITQSYTNRLLQLRGETIARTELLSSLHEAQDEGLRQMVEKGALREDQITRTWDAAQDKATRPSHSAMEGQKADLEGAFTTGNGARLKYPGDRSLGAPAAEIINCRCRIAVGLDFLKRSVTTPTTTRPITPKPRKPRTPKAKYKLKPTNTAAQIESNPNTPSAAKDTRWQQQVLKAERLLPKWLISQVENVPTLVHNSGFRANYAGGAKVVNISADTQADVIVHEYFHALDYAFGDRMATWGKKKGSQLQYRVGESLDWKTDDQKLNALAKAAREEFLRRDSKGKGKFNNGDGAYALGDWERDYEGRLYVNDGYNKNSLEKVSSEYITMGAQRYFNLFVDRDQWESKYAPGEVNAGVAMARTRMEQRQPAMVALLRYMFEEKK